MNESVSKLIEMGDRDESAKNKSSLDILLIFLCIHVWSLVSKNVYIILMMYNVSRLCSRANLP